LQTALVGKYFSQEFIQRVLSFNIALSAFNNHQKLLSGEKQAFPLLFLGAMLYSGGITNERKRSLAPFIRKACELRDENRTAIVRNLVFNVGKRAEREIEHGNSSQNGIHGSRGAEEDGRDAMKSQESSNPDRPILRQVPWLSPGFFKKSHFNMPSSNDVENTTPPASARKNRIIGRFERVSGRYCILGCETSADTGQ
jgi:hypothetical protein